MRRTFAPCSLLLLAAALVACLGCTKPIGPPSQPPPSQPKVLKLVVGDRVLAQQIMRVKGEWKARSGIELEVYPVKGPPESDAIIYDRDYLDVFVEDGTVRSLPAEWLNRDELHKTNLFDPGGMAECRWGEQVYAVPFGSQVYVLMYRRDLFDRFKLQPPQTWSEYQHVIDMLNAHRTEVPGLELAAIEELNGTFLARAAAYAKHPDYYATLFDKETMTPLINSPPFVRALEEMLAAKDPKYDESMAADAAAVHKAIYDGRLAMAITTMSAAAVKTDESKDATDSAKAAGGKEAAGRTTDIAFAELPGATEVYNPKSKSWSPNSKATETSGAPVVSHVTLLGASGLLGSVMAQSQSPEAAFQLLAWLSGDEWGGQICPASPKTTFFRQSQLKQPGRWVEPQLSADAAKQYAEVVATSLSRPQWLSRPRFRNMPEYMLDLYEEIGNAAAGKKTASEALNDAAKRWQELNDKFGVETQRASYIRSLGLEP